MTYIWKVKIELLGDCRTLKQFDSEKDANDYADNALKYGVRFDFDTASEIIPATRIKSILIERFIIIEISSEAQNILRKGLSGIVNIR